MRITIITGPFFGVPPAPCGAVERLWHDLAEEFAAAGHAVSVVCKRHGQQQADETTNGVHYIRRGGFDRSHQFSVNLLKDFLYAARTLAWLPRADVLVTNVFWTPVLAGLLRRSAGRIAVGVNRFPKNQLWLYRQAARFAVVSTAIKNEIDRQLPARPHLVRVFPNPIDTAVFRPPAEPRSFAGDKTIVYTGRVHPEKGIHVLIDAFAQLQRTMPGTHLKIAGPLDIPHGGGGDDYVRLLRQKAGNLPVEFLGPIYDRPQLADLLRSAHCYTYPSLAPLGEALPVAPIEAMATGLVPVVSDMSCFDDYVVEGETGYRFDYRGDGAPQRLCGVLLRVLSDPADAGRVGANAAAKAATFSNHEVARKYLADFQELLNN